MLRLRLALVVVAAVFAASALSGLGLAAPSIVKACSCMMPEPIANYADREDTYILKGTVVAMGADQMGLFKIDRYYQGSGDVEEVPIRAGNGADCGITMTVGQELVMVAYVEEGVLAPNICSPWGDVTTAEGQTLLADTVTAFGEGTAPGGGDGGGGAEPTDPPTGGEAPGGGETPAPTSAELPGWLLPAAGILGLFILVIGAASFVSMRRGS